MPGGFHPFHPGHKSLYDWAIETFGRENVYVAATNDTKSRPFPFDVKQKLAAMAGVPANRFIQVKSPFNALSYESIIGNPAETALVFVRSEKDKTSHPLPDQIRKSDGMMGYLVSYKNNDNLETADTHGYLAYGPTIDFNFSGMSIKSASELRAAWPEMSDEDKLKAANLMYPGSGETAAKLLDTALGVNEPVAAESFSPTQWLKNALNSDPQFKAWYRMYKADPVKAEKTFGTKHTEYLAQLGEDASPEEEDDFHTALDKLVHKTFGHSSDEKKKKKQEDAPPGREKQVKALKKKFDDPGAPYAIAWAQHNKHGKPRRKSRG